MPSDIEEPQNSPSGKPRKTALDRTQVEQRLKAFFEREASTDIDGLLELLAPDVVFFPPTTWGYARYPVTLRGAEAVREASGQRRVNYDFLPSIVHRILIDGDQALAYRTRQIRERGGGQLYTFDSVDLFRFRDGLIVEFVEFPDGAGRDLVVNFPH
jgi:ketosteroid isomerase-like protein